MEIIKPGTTIDFISKRKIALICSLVIIGASILSLIVHGGPRLGVDFAGGTNVTVKFDQPVTAEDIRGALSAGNLPQSTIQQFEESEKHEFIIQIQQNEGEPENTDNRVTNALTQRFGENSFDVEMVEMVGPKVGKDLRQKGFLSIVYAVIFMLIYIWIRFELRFGVGCRYRAHSRCHYYGRGFFPYQPGNNPSHCSSIPHYCGVFHQRYHCCVR